MPTRAPNATLQMVSRVANWTSLLASKACPRANLALWRHLLATVTEAPIRNIYILIYDYRSSVSTYTLMRSRVVL